MPPLPDHNSDQPGVVVWQRGDIACRVMDCPPHVEISLTVKGTEIERRVFSDHAAASDYAIDKMHVYEAGTFGLKDS